MVADGNSVDAHAWTDFSPCIVAWRQDWLGPGVPRRSRRQLGSRRRRFVVGSGAPRTAVRPGMGQVRCVVQAGTEGGWADTSSRPELPLIAAPPWVPPGLSSSHTRVAAPPRPPRPRGRRQEQSAARGKRGRSVVGRGWTTRVRVRLHKILRCPAFDRPDPCQDLVRTYFPLVECPYSAEWTAESLLPNLDLDLHVDHLERIVWKSSHAELGLIQRLCSFASFHGRELGDFREQMRMTSCVSRQ